MKQIIVALVLAAGCASDATSTADSALQCFHTSSAVECATAREAGALDRTKIEDFYPSACLDGDADLDGVPDFLDIDFLGSADAEAPVARDDLRCPRCNRGPGTQNDFRLRIGATAAELERGKVYVRTGDRLTVPTPEGELTIAITAATDVKDGDPLPGAEIRVRGSIANGILEAERVDVLCPAPAALPPADVPPSAEPPDAGPPLIL